MAEARPDLVFACDNTFPFLFTFYSTNGGGSTVRGENGGYNDISCGVAKLDGKRKVIAV